MDLAQADEEREERDMKYIWNIQSIMRTREF